VTETRQGQNLLFSPQGEIFYFSFFSHAKDPTSVGFPTFSASSPSSRRRPWSPPLHSSPLCLSSKRKLHFVRFPEVPSFSSILPPVSRPSVGGVGRLRRSLIHQPIVSPVFVNCPEVLYTEPSLALGQDVLVSVLMASMRFFGAKIPSSQNFGVIVLHYSLSPPTSPCCYDYPPFYSALFSWLLCQNISSDIPCSPPLPRVNHLLCAPLAVCCSPAPVIGFDDLRPFGSLTTLPLREPGAWCLKNVTFRYLRSCPSFWPDIEYYPLYPRVPTRETLLMIDSKFFSFLLNFSQLVHRGSLSPRTLGL